MPKVVYWAATALVTAELVAGGMWDVRPASRRILGGGRSADFAPGQETQSGRPQLGRAEM